MADAQGAPRSHSAAALEGIALLKQGCKVQKYTQNHAKAKLTTFKLSDDERTLSWEGEGVGGMLSSLSGKRRSIELADILEVVVGHEGALFRDGEESSGQANLALSLILMPSLPEARAVTEDIEDRLCPSPRSAHARPRVHRRRAVRPLAGACVAVPCHHSISVIPVRFPTPFMPCPWMIVHLPCAVTTQAALRALADDPDPQVPSGGPRSRWASGPHPQPNLTPTPTLTLTLALTRQP